MNYPNGKQYILRVLAARAHLEHTYLHVGGEHGCMHTHVRSHNDLEILQ